MQAGTLAFPGLRHRDSLSSRLIDAPGTGTSGPAWPRFACAMGRDLLGDYRGNVPSCKAGVF
ncbi:hypothetical protein A2G96_14305 [Cupriavidus nantongensis]|uniref:Uncharacterized protein n=1 Tax=Cupriavidus nantongensis TaxID=1796606 RepID=A0A142JL58_9BURK|nr:hypothetical protein A2G96_14305 [Cupriavidus nantongensis]